MLVMDAALADELHHLRARAYGPLADIDAESLERLRELEAALRSADGSAGDPLDARADERLDTSGAETTTADDVIVPIAGPADVDAADPSPRDGAQRRRTVALLWAASLVVVAIVASVLTVALTAIRPVSTGGEVRQIATLNAIPGFEMPEFFGTPDSDARGFEYHGLLLMTSTYGYFSRGDTCLAALDPEGIDDGGSSIAGPVYSDCAAGGFPATVKLVVDEEAPVELREELGMGTAVQFVLDGERIGVFTSEK